VTRDSDSVGAAHAYAQVRAAIVENRYPPGHRLIEQRIAEELGLSRTPVREALRMLEAEGLVVSERNRGAMVRPLSQTEVVDLYGLRIRLESYAVEVATERITEQELGDLVDAADAFGGVRRSVDVDTLDGVRMLNEANRRFHDGILSAARHHRLSTMLARTVDIPLVFQAFRTFGPAEIERSDTFHHLITEAMCRRDAGRGAALMAEHIAQGRDAVLDALAYSDISDITNLTDSEGPA
jgi:DNA-binding GntR family transcriptional regulator